MVICEKIRNGRCPRTVLTIKPYSHFKGPLVLYFNFARMRGCAVFGIGTLVKELFKFVELMIG